MTTPEFQLIFEGIGAGDARAMQRVKGVLIADLQVSILEAQQALAAPPYLLRQAGNEKDLLAAFYALRDAGALVSIKGPGGALRSSNQTEDQAVVDLVDRDMPELSDVVDLEFDLDTLLAEAAPDSAKRQRTKVHYLDMEEPSLEQLPAELREDSDDNETLPEELLRSLDSAAADSESYAENSLESEEGETDDVLDTFADSAATSLREAEDVLLALAGADSGHDPDSLFTPGVEPAIGLDLSLDDAPESDLAQPPEEPSKPAPLSVLAPELKAALSFEMDDMQELPKAPNAAQASLPPTSALNLTDFSLSFEESDTATLESDHEEILPEPTQTEPALSSFDFDFGVENSLPVAAETTDKEDDEDDLAAYTPPASPAASSIHTFAVEQPGTRILDPSSAKQTLGVEPARPAAIPVEMGTASEESPPVAPPEAVDAPARQPHRTRKKRTFGVPFDILVYSAIGASILGIGNFLYFSQMNEVPDPTPRKNAKAHEDFAFDAGMNFAEEFEPTPIPLPMVAPGAFVFRGSDSEGETEMRLSLGKNRSINVHLTLSTPMPPEATPEEIVRGIPRRPWLKRVLVEGLIGSLDVNDNFRGKTRSQAFIEAWSERRRVVAAAELQGHIDLAARTVSVDILILRGNPPDDTASYFVARDAARPDYQIRVSRTLSLIEDAALSTADPSPSRLAAQ